MAQGPNSPWPEADNPILGYLLARATELLAEYRAETTMTWLAFHAWFEPTLDIRTEHILHLGE